VFADPTQSSRPDVANKKVLSVIIRRNWFDIRLKSIAIALLAIVAAISLTPSRLSTQNMPVIIGRIEGDDLAVKTTTKAGIEIDAGPTVVASGSEVTVRSGHALILLDSGGEISICGPAHFTLVNSTGAITLALDYGRVHPSLSSSETFTIYTASVVATPVAISGARRDTTLGLDQNGEMCILTARGAMRVEPQFAGQSLIVPQGGVVNLTGGQIDSLHSDASSCSCDFPRASVERARPPISREIAALRHPVQPNRKKPDSATPPSLSPDPIYTVIMPPLSFDANSPAPPLDPSPETILLVREIRMRPTVVFRGHVNPALVPAAASILVAPTVPATPPPQRPVDDRRQAVEPGLMARLRTFFQKLKGQSPCAGAGCGN
jgi:hypothetical protein